MIGAALVRRGIAQGFEMVCIVHRNSKRIDNLPKAGPVTVLYADLPDYASFNPGIENCEAFIHLAWDKTAGAGRDDADIQARNIQYTLDAVRLARRMGCDVFVGAGSQAEYGPVSCALRADTPVNPESGYGIAKYAAGRLSKLLCEQLGMRQNWARILSVYGPLDGPHTLISYVIDELKHGRSPELTACEQTWDYLYCDDAADALLAIAQKGKNGAIYPLGSGQGRKLSEYIESIHKLVSPGVRINYGRRAYYPHQPMYLVGDISLLVSDTGWTPNWVFENGVIAMLSSIL